MMDLICVLQEVAMYNKCVYIYTSEHHLLLGGDWLHAGDYEGCAH